MIKVEFLFSINITQNASTFSFNHNSIPSQILDDFKFNLKSENINYLVESIIKSDAQAKIMLRDGKVVKWNIKYLDYLNSLHQKKIKGKIVRLTDVDIRSNYIETFSKEKQIKLDVVNF